MRRKPEPVRVLERCRCGRWRYCLKILGVYLCGPCRVQETTIRAEWLSETVPASGDPAR
jgi:hypothetical protein